MDQVRATRMELMARRSQAELATQGAQLLEGKREALLKELLSMTPSLIGQISALFSSLRLAARSLAYAEAFDGQAALRSQAWAGPRQISVDFDEEIFWGVRLPRLEAGQIKRDIDQLGVPPTSISARSREATSDFEDLLSHLLALAPNRTRLSRLGDEVRKTSRRVNALNQVLIPRLEQDIKFISQALEEREREDQFRLRRIKKRKRDANRRKTT